MLYVAEFALICMTCRILRVLRVFRMRHVVARHMEGAVVEAAGKLIFSLVSILFIAAGLFYEVSWHTVLTVNWHATLPTGV